jgi:hypothetical protein
MASDSTRNVPPKWSPAVKESPLRFSFMATLILLVLAATAGGAAAQAPTPAAVSAHQATIRALRDSQWVRLVTPTFARQEGRLLSHEHDALMLDRGADSLLHIPAMDVDSLWVRGTSWQTGAVIGSVLGLRAACYLERLLRTIAKMKAVQSAPVHGSYWEEAGWYQGG